MTTLRWKYGDADTVDSSDASSDWSRAKGIKEFISDLGLRQDLDRPISITIDLCLAEVNEEEGSIVLKCADASQSFMRIEEASADAVQSSLLQEGSFVALRSCLASGNMHAMTKWMWNDAGLTPWIPAWIHLAKNMRYRWSNWQTLESTCEELVKLKGTKHALRPLRLVVCPDVSISFVCIADTVADACMALNELTGGTAINTDDEMESCTGSHTLWEPLSHMDSFKSVVEYMSDEEHQAFNGGLMCKKKTSIRTRSTEQDESFANVVKQPSKNHNKISHFRWIQGLLEQIASSTAGDRVTHLEKQEQGTPLFVVAGACPNFATPMQAVLYSQVAGAVDFWWIKPKAGNKNSLEAETLNFHSGGTFKNAAGRSREVYAPIADKFNESEDGSSGLQYGVDESGRAFIEESKPSGERMRMLLYLVWQESWSHPLARNKFLQGKIFYQRWWLDDSSSPPPDDGHFFSRQYRIESHELSIAPWQEEEEISNLFPEDSSQDMYEMTQNVS